MDKLCPAVLPTLENKKILGNKLSQSQNIIQIHYQLFQCEVVTNTHKGFHIDNVIVIITFRIISHALA